MLKNLMLVIGARPQFIKLAALFPALKPHFRVTVVHTGQHYEDSMSTAFLEEFGLPSPDFDLQIGSRAAPIQTGQMMIGLVPVFDAVRPDAVVVFGDTNSTLAGALAAAQTGIPVVHVEAGLRSFSSIPEERNRVLTDRLSSLLLAPSETARENLRREGLVAGVKVVGDVMLDLVRANQAHLPSTREDKLVLTIHRASNTEKHRFESILTAVARSGESVVFPCHPRCRDLLAQWRSRTDLGNIQVLEPQGYKEMLGLVRSSRLVLTDSGGLQKEAYYLGTPCLTLRERTEWTETVDNGWNLLVGADSEAILRGIRSFRPGTARPPLYGNGFASELIATALKEMPTGHQEKNGEREIRHAQSAPSLVSAPE